MVFIKLDQFVSCIYSRLSSSILKVPYLLHEHPMALLAPAYHPRIKCEKTQINNLFESIQDEDTLYSIALENITAEEICSKHLHCIFFMCFFICIIYSIRSIRKSLKLVARRPATLLKNSLWHRRFPVNFVKFIRTFF